MGALLRCAVLETSLYTEYYLGSCVPCALYCIPNHIFIEAPKYILIKHLS